MLALSLADDALDAHSLTSSRKIFGLLDDGRFYKLRCKPSMQNIPIFRKAACKGKHGISLEDPLGQSVLVKQMGTAAIDLGFRRAIKPYSLRRAAGKEVDEENSSEAQRCQAMSHSSSRIYLQHYMPDLVGADVQSAYLRQPSQKDLQRELGRMGLDADPRAPTTLSKEQLADVRFDPEIVALEIKARELREECKTHRVRITVDKTNSTVQKYEQISKDVKSLQNHLVRRKLDQVREEFFDQIDSLNINARFGDPKTLEELEKVERSKANTQQQHTFHELTRLENTLFTPPTSEFDRLALRSSAVDDMVALIPKQSQLLRRKHVRRGKIYEPELKSEQVLVACPDLKIHLDSIIVVSDSGCINDFNSTTLTCIFCWHNQHLNPAERTYAYSRKVVLSRHIFRTHLKIIGEESEIYCPDPQCMRWCRDRANFLNHLAR
ncbi:MAG: hypothetical protein Q9162_007947, partial [Coniocarpon cinnabarinum]